MSARFTRRDFLKISSATLLASALGGYGAGQVIKTLAHGELPPPVSDSPNVILILLDTVRAQSLSLYGYNRLTTPNLERIATKGTLFENAFAPSSWTLPSIATIFTSRYSHELGVDHKVPLDNTYPTLAEVFTRLGYHTAGFIANTWICSREYGLQRGFLHYEDYRVSPGQVMKSSALFSQLVYRSGIEKRFANHENFGRKSAEQVNRDFLHWLDRDSMSRPFFAFLNYFDAHDPYLPPLDFALKFSPQKPDGSVPIEEVARTLDPLVIRELRDAYDGTLAYLDYHIGQLYDELDRLGLLTNTLLIITSDHGEHFGEHNLMLHGNSLYPFLIKVPLLLLYPGFIPARKALQAPVTLLDLAVTILDLAGLPNIANFRGKSMRRYWENATKEEMVFSEVLISQDTFGMPSEWGWMKSLIYEGMHYIRNPHGREELYNLVSDPGELQDLASQIKFTGLLKYLRNSVPG